MKGSVLPEGLDEQLLAAYLGGANDANAGVRCKRETYVAWKARYAIETELPCPAVEIEEDLTAIKTSAILREIIEAERERDVTGGFPPALARRVAALYAEMDKRVP